MGRRTGGRKARARGDVAEQAVIAGFDIAYRRKQCVFSKTYPEVRVVWRNGRKEVIFSGVGAPDFVAAVNIGGNILPMWLEIKTSGKVSMMTSRSVHQYDALIDLYNIGGLAAYLVLWRHDKTSRTPLIDEWRIHPIHTVFVDYVTNTITIERETGIVVISASQPSLIDEYDADVWLRQPAVPDIMKIASILNNLNTEDTNANI